MNFQPLDRAHLVATQEVASELFPWEREHTLALAATVSPVEHAAFYSERRLSSVRCWTAHLGRGPVCGLGMLYGYQAQPDELWLAWFGLLPAARGFGGGARMLDWLIASARAEGRHTLRLWTTDESEYARATQLYTRRGFTAEEHAPLPGEDWKTFVFSLGLDGQMPIAWSAVLDRPHELCGREAPVAAAAAA
ncbi:MAG TPA: GNAT family N-acetyltransferase [Opitutaceae bacterium]|nr:GNAT family N-acetyltransferase [Opitutaceae bacterium]